MSLRIGAASGDGLLVTAASSNNNFTAISVVGWLYPTTLTRNRRLWSKAAVFEGWECVLRQGSSPGADAINWEVERATVNAAAQGAAATMTTDVWHCIATTYSEGDGPRIYQGTLATAFAEVSYNTRDVGSGATAAATANIGLGNETTFNAPFQGRFGPCALFNRQLSLAELQSMRFNFQALAGCVGLWWPGHSSTSALDGSGAGNNAAVQGGLSDADPPLLKRQPLTVNIRPRAFAPGIAR